MALNLNKTFGQTFGQTNDTASSSDKPKAQIWINVGYPAVAADGTEMFVSLPGGIPLDTTAHLPIRGSNAQFNKFTASRNGLQDQILEAAEALAPGESKIIGGDENGLQIQLRRINNAAEAPANDETNEFARKLTF